jgi:manganese efflux pump family protein
MKWAALITWILTAGFGFVMLAIWLSHGGLRAAPDIGIRRIRPPLILSHFLLAAAGLVVWIIYVATDEDALAWIAFATLVVVALLGWTMFAIWWRSEQARAEGPPDTRPEARFPKPVIAVHGLLAVTTVLLVFLTAVGVGD